MDDGGSGRFLGFLVLLVALAISVAGFIVAKRREREARAAGRAKHYKVPPALVVIGVTVIGWMIFTIVNSQMSQGS